MEGSPDPAPHLQEGPSAFPRSTLGVKHSNSEQDVEALFGRLVDHHERKGTASSLRRTAVLWAKLYDGDPYQPEWLGPDLVAAFMEEGSLDDGSAPKEDDEVEEAREDGKAWEEVRAGMRVSKEWVIEDGNWLPHLRRFLDKHQVSAPLTPKRARPDLGCNPTAWLGFGGVLLAQMEDIMEEKQLSECLEGYGRFLTKKKAATEGNKADHADEDHQDDDDEDEEAMFDVDIMWCTPLSLLHRGSAERGFDGMYAWWWVVGGRHSHMVHPQSYWANCRQMGLVIDHHPWPDRFPPPS